MAQYGVAVLRDDSDPSVLGSARTEASAHLGDRVRAETHTLDSFEISHLRILQHAGHDAAYMPLLNAHSIMLA